jgi:hypothetical protein
MLLSLLICYSFHVLAYTMHCLLLLPLNCHCSVTQLRVVRFEGITPAKVHICMMFYTMSLHRIPNCESLQFFKLSAVIVTEAGYAVQCHNNDALACLPWGTELCCSVWKWNVWLVAFLVEFMYGFRISCLCCCDPLPVIFHRENGGCWIQFTPYLSKSWSIWPSFDSMHSGRNCFWLRAVWHWKLICNK